MMRKIVFGVLIGFGNILVIQNTEAVDTQVERRIKEC